MFIYDYHPLAETLKVRHFGSPPSRMANGSHSLLDDGRPPGGYSVHLLRHALAVVRPAVECWKTEPFQGRARADRPSSL
jgi:hypothetical protein